MYGNSEHLTEHCIRIFKKVQKTSIIPIEVHQSIREVHQKPSKTPIEKNKIPEVREAPKATIITRQGEKIPKTGKAKNVQFSYREEKFSIREGIAQQKTLIIPVRRKNNL